MATNNEEHDDEKLLSHFLCTQHSMHQSHVFCHMFSKQIVFPSRPNNQFHDYTRTFRMFFTIGWEKSVKHFKDKSVLKDTGVSQCRSLLKYVASPPNWLHAAASCYCFLPYAIYDSDFQTGVPLVVSRVSPSGTWKKFKKLFKFSMTLCPCSFD